MPSRSAAHTALCEELKLWANSRKGDVRLWQVHQGHGRDTMGHHFKQGLINGASDFIGIFHETGIYPTRRRRCRGRFLAFEVKTGKANPSPEQQAFLELVNAYGGIGRVIRSIADADHALEEARRLP